MAPSHREVFLHKKLPHWIQTALGMPSELLSFWFFPLLSLSFSWIPVGMDLAAVELILWASGLSDIVTLLLAWLVLKSQLLRTSQVRLTNLVECDTQECRFTKDVFWSDGTTGLSCQFPYSSWSAASSSASTSANHTHFLVPIRIQLCD